MRTSCLALLMMQTWCAIAQPTNEEYFGAWQTSASRTNASQFFQFTKAIENHLGSRLDLILSEEIIAGSVKCHTSSVPQAVSQELIVKIAWEDRTARTNVSLVLVEGYIGEGSGAGAWQVAPDLNEIPSVKHSGGPLDTEQIVQFIKSSNFGRNDYHPTIEVLRIRVYVTDPEIIHAVEAGISPEEKSRRFGLTLNHSPRK